MKIKISETAFKPWILLDEYQQTALKGKTDYGATATFVGTMRDFNEGDDVQALYLEHYPGMTEKKLAAIAEQAMQEWSLDDCLIVHRVGLIHPGEAIVLTATWSAHRKAALEACRYLIETLKHQAPFWKRETLRDGQQRWVAKNTAG